MEDRLLNHEELLAVHSKDKQYYREWIGDRVHELAQKYLGVKRWIHLREAITILSRLGYFTATTLSGIPTPGEEFCDASIVKPRFLKAISMVLINNEFQSPREISSLLSLIEQFQLTTYFMFGDFYELAKRVSNFSYTTSQSGGCNRTRYFYKLVGCMSIVKLLLQLSKMDVDRDNRDLDTGKNNGTVITAVGVSSSVDARKVCHLCSETRKQPTSTLCGHIFCWNCIHEWLREKSHCPLCRNPTEASRLVHLINFR